MTHPAPVLTTEAANAGSYPATRFNQRERMMAKSVKEYVESGSYAPAGSITNAQLAGTAGTVFPGISGLSQVATVIYDRSAMSGAVGTVPLNVILPAGVLVWAVSQETLVEPTSTGSTGTYKLFLPTDGDLTFPVTADGTVPHHNTVYDADDVALGLKPRNTSAPRQLSLEIATNAITAGKVRFFVHYVQAGTTAPVIQTLIDSLLGASNTYEVLAGSTVTNTGTTTVDGNVGVSPGSAITGFPPGVITNGTQNANNASAIAAQSALVSSLAALAALASTATIAAELGGTTRTAGVYDFTGGAATLTGTLTLDAQGNTGAQFVFRPSSTLTTATSSQILLINGAQPANVIFRVGSSATLGTSTTFRGNILADTAITLNTSATIAGRLMARTAAVTLDTNAATRS